jgi:uncharacterized membrane protein
MRNLSTTVAVYETMEAAEQDWAAIEASAEEGAIDLADAALVTRTEDGVTAVQRLSHHGWGKGALTGAVVGILFPPSLVGGAVAGAAGGSVIARLNRSLDRGDIKDLGDVMDSGDIVVVILTSQVTAETARGLLRYAKESLSRESSTAEDVMAALSADDTVPAG